MVKVGDYILVNHFDNTETIKTEKELRDLYYEDLKEIIKECKDNNTIKNLKQELDNVYLCDFNKVKKTLEEDNFFYEIKESE